MKKMLSFLLTVALLLSAFALCTLTASATERTSVTMQFGSAEVELTLVENFATFEAAPSLGIGTVSNDDGKIKMESSSMVDMYGIQSPMLAENNDLTGAVNFVFSVKNRSDGDIFFCFQPTSPSAGNLFLAPTSEESPVWLVSTNGKAETTKSNVSQDTVGGRFAYIVPMGFEGYIVVPAALITAHNQWSTPYFNGGDPVLTNAGFHVAVDDAIYLEVILDDMFICGELPTYEAPNPVETTVPETEPVTEPETTVADTAADTTAEPETTALVETVPETATDTTVSTVPETTEAGTDADTTTEPAKEGCGAVMGGLMIISVAGAAMAVAVRKKKEN